MRPAAAVGPAAGESAVPGAGRQVAAARVGAVLGLPQRLSRPGQANNVFVDDHQAADSPL